MRLSKYFLPVLKETPKEAEIISHRLMLRAGLISQEKRGRVKWCKLEPDALKAASVWMQGFGQFEPVNLDA